MLKRVLAMTTALVMAMGIVAAWMPGSIKVLAADIGRGSLVTMEEGIFTFFAIDEDGSLWGWGGNKSIEFYP